MIEIELESCTVVLPDGFDANRLIFNAWKVVMQLEASRKTTLVHSSVQTTERYIDVHQDLTSAPPASI